jgi:hypothetical protein
MRNLKGGAYMCQSEALRSETTSARVSPLATRPHGRRTGTFAVIVLLGILAWFIPAAEATHNYTINIINRQGNKHNIKDIVVEVIGIPSIDAIDALGPFTRSTAVPPNRKAVKFDGAAIRPGDMGTVVIDLTHKLQGISPVTLDEVSWSSSPLAFGVSNLIFSGAIASGATGPDFAGIPIPAGEFLYLYEFGWLGPGSGPTRFEVAMDAGPPTSFGVLNDTWNPAFLMPTELPNTFDMDGFTVGSTFIVSPTMLPENLTGVGGVLPTSWSYSGGKMVAEYAAPLPSGAVSSVLWFTHPRPPEYGGAKDLAFHNAALLDGSGTLFTAAVEAPVPEPTSGILICVLGFVLVSVRIKVVRNC